MPGRKKCGDASVEEVVSAMRPFVQQPGFLNSTSPTKPAELLRTRGLWRALMKLGLSIKKSTMQQALHELFQESWDMRGATKESWVDTMEPRVRNCLSVIATTLRKRPTTQWLQQLELASSSGADGIASIEAIDREDAPSICAADAEVYYGFDRELQRAYRQPVMANNKRGPPEYATHHNTDGDDEDPLLATFADGHEQQITSCGNSEYKTMLAAARPAKDSDRIAFAMDDAEVVVTKRKTGMRSAWTIRLIEPGSAKGKGKQLLQLLLDADEDGISKRDWASDAAARFAKKEVNLDALKVEKNEKFPPKLALRPAKPLKKADKKSLEETKLTDIEEEGEEEEKVDDDEEESEESQVGANSDGEPKASLKASSASASAATTPGVMKKPAAARRLLDDLSISEPEDWIDSRYVQFVE